MERQRDGTEIQRLFEQERRRNKEQETADRIRYLEQLNASMKQQAPNVSEALKRAYSAEDQVGVLRLKLSEMKQQKAAAEAQVANMREMIVILARDQEKEKNELREKHREELEKLRSQLKAEHAEELFRTTMKAEKNIQKAKERARRRRREITQAKQLDDEPVFLASAVDNEEEEEEEEEEEAVTGTDLLYFVMQSAALDRFFPAFHDFGIESVEDLSSDEVTIDILTSQDIGMTEDDVAALWAKIDELHRLHGEESTPRETEAFLPKSLPPPPEGGAP